MATYKKLLKNRAGDTIIPVTERDVYSTTEQVVGQWTDGKPIYRRVFSGTITNTANTRANATLWSGSPIEKLISMGGWIRYATSGMNYIPHGESTAEFRIIYVQDGSNNLNLAVLSAAAYTNRPYELWVEYTKNTD